MAKTYSPRERPELSEMQKSFINENYEVMDLRMLVQKVWEDDTVTLRDIKGIAVREYLADMKGFIPDTNSGSYVPKQPVDLTPEQKNFIEQNLSKMKPIELTALLFEPTKPPGWRPSYNGKEYKAVTDFIQSKDPDAIDQAEIPVEEAQYRPPQSIMVLLGWANRYIPTGDPNKSAYNTKGLKPQEENNLRTLLSYMKTVRFTIQASQYEKQNERELFISTFIQFCHDKPDLTPEEVHQYIQAAAETVNIMQIERYIQRLNGAIEEDVIDSAGNKQKKPSLVIIEMMNKSRSNLEDSKERLKKLLTTLVGTRADRMENQVNTKQSIIPLIQAWRSEEKRNELIAIAEREKLEDAREYERLKNLEDVQVLIAGLTREEAME